MGLAVALMVAELAGCRGGAEQRSPDGSPPPDANRDVPTTVDRPAGDGVDTGKPPKQNGETCYLDGDCRSGFCVEGFCCDTACEEVCHTCSALIGTCTLVDVDKDPRDQCPDEGSGSCKRTGVCDGTGACALYSQGTVCQQPGCAGSSLTSAGRCDGAGTCMGAATQSCAPFKCADNGQCRTTCTVDGDCVAPNTCVMQSCGKKPLGGTCGDNAECNSGFCAQGVCCGTACTGACKSCALSGSAGTCTNVPAGQDPAMDCADAGAMMCGLDGACNGMGACRTYASGTTCGMTTCMNGAEMLAGKCNGTGVCAAGALNACSPYVCGASACKTSCATNADCAAGFVCNATICGKKTSGATCTTAAECTSGYCEQGVCCNTGCSAACVSCNLGSTRGTCTPIPAGMPPLIPASQCVAATASPCGNDGMCSGAGACRQYAAGTVCAAATCSGSTLTPARTCDGMGVCRPPGASSGCDPFQCGTNGACRTTCATTADCVSPNTCMAMSCGKKPNGATCTTAPECNSGVCAQGVCCATACTGTCKSCALAGSGGTCANVPDGQVPTPAMQCTDMGAMSCGNDGTCNGAGACRNYVSGTQCMPAQCPIGSTFTPPRLCNGAGACAAATTSACNPYLCDTTANACKTTCTTNGDCASPNVCNSGGTCSKKGLGQTCVGANECASGFCAQGVCCATACTGTCQSCALAASPGTCSNIAAGMPPTPATQCMDAGATTCGTNGLCNGLGACQQYASGTVCLQGSCNVSTLTPARTCDGAGVCRTVTSSLCDPYGCDTTARVCKTMCATAADCASPNICTGTSCGSKPNGASCAAGSECNSSICQQFVCCSTTCAGTCRSCAIATSLGTCAAVPAGDDPLNQCTAAATSTCDEDGACNGSGACRVYASGTQCGGPTCIGSTFTAASTCNGTGTCNTPASTSCSPYLCNTTTNVCRATCASNADCLAPNFVCIGTTCSSATMLTVQLAVDAAASVQWITVKLRITNNGTTAVPLSDLTARYWYTYDTTPVVAQAGMCNYAFTPPGACSNVTTTWTAVSPARTNADFYYQIGFAAAAGNLSSNATAEFQVQFHKNDWLNYTQTGATAGDYSFNGSTAFATTTKVTVYRAGTLVYGTEP